MPNETPMPQTARFTPAPPPSYRPLRPAHGLDASTRRLLIAAGGVLALLLLLVAGWAVSGRHGGGGGAVPTIQADKQPLRVKPENPGGLQVIGVNERGGDAPGQPGATVPAPELPAPEALRAAQPKPERPPSAPAAASPSTPVQVAPAPAPASAAAPQAQPAVPARAPAPAANMLVQLAAVDSEAGARTEWQRLRGRMADMLANRQPVYQRVERDGHALWRIRIGGFASVAEATRFCERVRAKGAACDLATF